MTGTDSGMLQVLDETRDRLPDIFDMEDIRSRVAEPTPYIMVAIQVSTRHLISPPSSHTYQIASNQFQDQGILVK